MKLRQIPFPVRYWVSVVLVMAFVALKQVYLVPLLHSL